jgi:hypothetical protein
VASTIVIHHTISPSATNARGWSHAASPASWRSASLIAVTDQGRAAGPVEGSPSFSRFQAIRHGAEQNLACSRRGSNTEPHCGQDRASPIT